MGGKSWSPWAEVVVTPAAGEDWRAKFPRLDLWSSYRAGVPVDRPHGVVVKNRADGVVFLLRPDVGRRLMCAIEDIR
jgi:hypothetical protein